MCNKQGHIAIGCKDFDKIEGNLKKFYDRMKAKQESKRKKRDLKKLLNKSDDEENEFELTDRKESMRKSFRKSFHENKNFNSPESKDFQTPMGNELMSPMSFDKTPQVVKVSIFSNNSQESSESDDLNQSEEGKSPV